jgi:formylglycine-generating enzyme required for sulfatase activity
MTLAQGQILNNRYRIVKLLGQGGFGAVYKAWDTTLNVPCAVKESFELVAETQRQFLREAQILAGLRHPNLPRVTDYFAVPAQGQYLVMDYVEGQDLEELRAQAGGRLPESQALGWISQVCDALSYLHRQKPAIIHRDIKPANIKIVPPDEDYPLGRAMLVDFGIAKTFDPSMRTTMGARAVTPGYSPFEQYGQTAAATDARTDIYALGATLYTLLCGQEPVESVLRMVRDPLVSPRQHNPDISPEAEAAILRAMQNDPEQRFQSATQLKQALLPARHVTPVPLPGIEDRLVTPVSPIHTVNPAVATPVSVQPIASAMVAPKRRDVPWGWLAGGAMGLVLLVGIMFMVAKWVSGNQSAIRQTSTSVAMAAMHSSTPAQSETLEVTQSPIASKTPGITQSPTPEPTIVSTMTSSVDGMVMVYVEAGDFLMGSSEQQIATLLSSCPGCFYFDEQPRHLLYLDAFWIDQTEVTNAQYAMCVIVGRCDQPTDGSSSTRGTYYGNAEYANYPVIYVNWDDANTYCTWSGRRLPTEAEWEKAGRGTDRRTYPWGEGIDCTLANLHGCVGDTSAVGSYPLGISPYGALDMAGNVFEWVADRYDTGYYSVSPYNNPSGPNFGQSRSVRGGSWTTTDDFLRMANRSSEVSEYWDLTLGFRCALSP